MAPTAGANNEEDGVAVGSAPGAPKRDEEGAGVENKEADDAAGCPKREEVVCGAAPNNDGADCAWLKSDGCEAEGCGCPKSD